MNKIKEYREKRGISQEDLAALLKVDQPSVSKWENGIKEPRLSTLRKIASALNCNYLDLIGEGELFREWLRTLLKRLVESGFIGSYEYDDSNGQILINKENKTLDTNDAYFTKIFQKQIKEAEEFIMKLWTLPENKKMIIADRSEWPEEGIDLSEPGEVIEFPEKNGC